MIRSKSARVLAFGVCTVLCATVLPVSAGPVPLPPACDPTVSGLGIPACPSVLVHELGELERPVFKLPDLTPDVNEIYIDFSGTNDQGQLTGPKLNFDTWAMNVGQAPVDLKADEPTDINATPVSQCVAWTTDLVCRERRSAGGISWHGEHLHFHFDGFASYALRRLLPDGTVDASAAGLIAESPKMSFCLLDSQRIADDAVPASRYNTCTHLEEGVSAGWSDVYPAGIEGQFLPLDGLQDGTYALAIAMNVEGALEETDLSNNAMVAIVQLSNLAGMFPLAEIVEKRPA